MLIDTRIHKVFIDRTLDFEMLGLLKYIHIYIYIFDKIKGYKSIVFIHKSDDHHQA